MDTSRAHPSDCPDEPSFSRRTVLRLAAAGAAGSALLPAGVAEAATEADGPILKPIPEQYFIVYGTNAETRWDSVDHDRFLTPQPRLFVRNHTRTPRIDAAAASGVMANPYQP